jgi:AAHS family 4-hydroxybenzoate transporter-like MFS transporter
MTTRTVSVKEIFDTTRFTTYQALVCLLCFLVTFLDGFDLTVIGVALPKMADFLKVKPSALGVALSVGQFGPLIGALVLGTLSDRWGRKWMLAISAVIFGVFTLMTAFVTSVQQVALYRFLAGLGLGGAVPNALAFGSEYAPPRSRATFAATMYAGMPGGSVLGALSAVWLIPHYGWESLFLLGGAAPIAIAIAVAVALPESLEFLVGRNKDESRIRSIVGKIAPDLAKDVAVQFVPSEKKLPGVPFRHLFTEGRAAVTFLLWIGLIGSLYSMWVLTAWAPTLMRKTGASVQQYSLATAGLHFGAFVATIFIGRLMDKFNRFTVLLVGFVLSCVSLVSFGQLAAGSFAVIFMAAVASGLFTNGSNNGLLAAAVISYPPAIRGTGTGWAYAIAKIGAMLAPAVGGFMLSSGWTVSQICNANAVVALFVAVVVIVLKGRVAAADRIAAKAGVQKLAATSPDVPGAIRHGAH